MHVYLSRLLTSTQIPASKSQNISVKQKILPHQEHKIHQLAMQATHITSYRSTNVRLSDLNRKLSLANSFILEKKSGMRLCYYNNKLWLPTLDGNSIDVYSVTGILQRSITSDQLKEPVSLHPVDDRNMILADANGLFLMDSQGEISRKIMAGNMCDVHVDGNTVVALEEITWDQGKVHVFNNNTSLDIEKSFLLEKNPVQSIMIVSSNIYVSFEAHHETQCNDYIGKYSMHGNKLAQYGKSGEQGPGEFDCPILCASDSEGSLLVTDTFNNRLQVLDSDGQWSVIMNLPTDNKEVLDAVFDGQQNKYVLCSDAHNQTKIFRLHASAAPCSDNRSLPLFLLLLIFLSQFPDISY